MRISWKWLNELVDLGKVKGPEELAEILTNRGLEVEAVERQDKGFEKVVTAQILARDPHPNSDRLSLCKVSLGSGEPLEIVCGAQNMKAGDKVALAQVGADLPNGIKIAQSKIRGVTSNGMLCSEEELKLADSSEGILILPPSTPLGRPLAELLGRDDTVLTFKLTANRGDCMSHWGMAREVAAALGVKPRRPAAKALDFGRQDAGIAIHLDAGESAPQFYGVSLEGVRIGPSPEWVARRLEAVGSRSINNVVDATNLVMLELGHPMHAYDATLVEGGEIRVRMARQGEKLPLLDGGEVTLAGTELVIADGKRAVGLAGVMGGGNSEVRDGTTRLFLEAAEFNPGLVRKAAARHVRRTDAAQRFEKGIDPTAVPFAISRLAEMIVQLAGGRVTGASFKAMPSREPGRIKPREIRVNPAYFPAFLGMDIAADEAERILAGLDCQVSKAGTDWTVAVPPYRLDLTIPEDLAEEVARSAGYDRIRETVPPLTTEPRPTSANPSAARIALIDKAKDALARAGLNETLNLSFTSQAWLDKFGVGKGLRVLNPLSEEYEAMVPSLIPGLVRNALTNWHHHFGSEPLPIRLFELRPTFSAPADSAQGLAAKGEMETTAVERWKLAIAISGPRYAQGLRNEQGEVDFLDLKAVFEGLFDALGARGVRLSPMSQSRSGGNPLFHPGQSVEILAGNSVAGAFGLLHPAKARELKCRAPLWIAEIDWEALSKLCRPALEPRQFKAWPAFPAIERDFALLVRNEVTADKITQLAIKAGKPLAKVAKVFDVYRGQQVAEGMTSVAVRVIFYEETRSLQESEAEAASTQILESWKKELGAELRG